MRNLLFCLIVTAFTSIITTTAFCQPEIEVKGYGAPPERAVNAAQAKLMAREAAIAYGYWALARTIEEIKVDAETRVRDCMTQSQKINLSVETFIKGAEIVDEYQHEDGTYEVTMILPLENEETSIIKIVEPVVEKKKPEPRQNTGIELRVKMRGINPVAKIYINEEEIRKYNKSAQYIYYDYTKIYDDDNEHTLLLETQTYGYKNYIITKTKEDEIVLAKEITAHGGKHNSYVCIAEFDFRSLECNYVNPYGF